MILVIVMKTLVNNEVVFEFIKLLSLCIGVTVIFFLLDYLGDLYIAFDYKNIFKKIVAIFCFGVLAIGYANYMNNVKEIKSKKQNN